MRRHRIRQARDEGVDECAREIGAVREDSLNVHWERYVGGVLPPEGEHPRKGPRRELALGIPRQVTVSPDQLLEDIPDLLRRYATCGERSRARDLDDLAKTGLVERLDKRLYRARAETVQAFTRPWRGASRQSMTLKPVPAAPEMARC